MATRNDRLRLSAAGAAFGILSSLAACSDSEPDKVESLSTDSPLYAVMYEVFSGDDDSSSSYLSVFDSLNIDELDTKNAREFAGGRAHLQSYNNWVFVGEPATPNILRFVVRDDGELEQDGSLSLGNYGLTDAAIDDWGVNFISPTKAYFFTGQEGVTIIWDPSEMEISGEIPAPEGYVRDGYLSNTSTAVIRGDRLYRALYWEEDETAKAVEEQRLLVYDIKNDELVDSIKDDRCPAPGNRAFLGDDDTIYFSNWIWGSISPLVYDGPDNCVLRVLPEADAYDPDWTLTFNDVADGRQGGMFTYLKDGKGLMSIFHDEDVPEKDLTDPYGYVSNPNWEIWNVDIEARSGSPLKGVPLNTGAYTPVTLDGRLFLMVPEADWDGTQMYEVSGDSAEPYVKVPGWSYMFQKIR